MQKRKSGVLLVYTIVFMDAMIAAFTPAIMALMINLTHMPFLLLTVALLYLVIKYGIAIANQYYTVTLKYQIKVSTYLELIPAEWKKGTATSDILAKINLSRSISRCITSDIPGLLDMCVQLTILLVTCFVIGALHGFIYMTTLSLGIIITSVKARYAASIQDHLYNNNSDMLSAIDSKDHATLNTWLHDVMCVEQKFAKIDAVQIMWQAPLIVIGAMTSLAYSAMDASSTVLIIGVYIALFRQVDMFAWVQESIVSLSLTAKKMAV
jgi:hypothetical protein